MHTQHTLKLSNKPSIQIVSSAGKSALENELDRVAAELNQLSRRFLRDNVLSGILSGLEDDIRQDAVLKAMEWYLKGTSGSKTDSKGKPENSWHAPRALSAALKFQKLRYVKSLSEESRRKKGFEDFTAGHCLHPFDLTPFEWPQPSVTEFIREGIEIAVRTGRISHANACVALLVYCEGVPATEVAKRRNVNRSAISQQLARVRHTLPEILETIEAPFLWQLH